VTQMIRGETLTVVVENVPAAEGKIMIEVLAGKTQFDGTTEADVSFRQRANAGSMTFSTSNLPAGEYAVRIMHDRNGNGELDSNFAGMPTETWAFSNNAAGNFGPPKWPDVKFDLHGSIVQSIKLSL
jgi:uncharacterized protein (DUF2141 family)